MREHLYRGKRRDNGEWIEGDLCKFMNGQPCIMPVSYFATREFDEEGLLEDGMAIGAFYPVIPETVGQFTGRTDRKEKQIFEGDRNQDNGVCVWNADDASFCWDYKAIGLEPMGEEDSWCEIRGNIHDT